MKSNNRIVENRYTQLRFKKEKKDICGNCIYCYDDTPNLREEPFFCKKWGKYRKHHESCYKFKEWTWDMQSTLDQFVEKE